MRELKKLGGIKPPREFVFMDRAAIGLGGALIRWRAAQFSPAVRGRDRGFRHDALATRQKKAFKATGVPLPELRAAKGKK